MPTTKTPPQMTGPKARFRGKERQRVLTFALTRAGHAALAARLADGRFGNAASGAKGRHKDVGIVGQHFFITDL